MLIIIIVGALIFALFMQAWSKHAFRRTAPALMTSLGILGTFLGILIALLALPDKNIGPDDIKALLSGMKTAFITSCMGLAAAVGARWIWWVGDPENEQIGRGESEIIAELQGLRTETREGFDKLDGLVDAIKDALVKSLEKLIEEIRTVIMEELKKSLNELIEAINKTINEKLGEKLDEFNESVDQLREWQVDHREQVAQLTVAFQESAAGIRKIREDCERIPETMDALRELLVVAQSQVDELNARLQAFAEMKEQAEKAFPAIRAELNNVMNAMNGVAGKFNALGDVIEIIHGDAVKRIEESAKKLADKHEAELKKVVENMDKETKAAVEKLHELLASEMEAMAQEWGENLIAIAKAYSNEINKLREGGR